MDYLTNISSIVLLTLSMIALPSSTAKKTWAIGCDTYYRITGQIAGCTEASTENARELWLERYSTCLEIQLSREISIYKLMLRTHGSVRLGDLGTWGLGDLETLGLGDLETLGLGDLGKIFGITNTLFTPSPRHPVTAVRLNA